MKRPVIATLLLAVGLALPGCPIYDDEGCSSDSHCAPGYSCQASTGDCVLSRAECDEPDDCRSGATCDRNGACRSVDCSWADVGCVDGYECARDEGVWRCVAESSSSGGSGNGAGGAPAGGAASAGQGGSGDAGASSQGGSGGEPAAGGASADGGQGGAEASAAGAGAGGASG